MRGQISTSETNRRFEVLKSIEKKIDSGTAIQDACKSEGIGYVTLYRWAEKLGYKLKQRRNYSRAERAEFIRRIEDRMKRGATVNKACKGEGISTRSFYEWKSEQRKKPL